MSTKDLSCLLVGKTSQGRGSDEREEALIQILAVNLTLNKSPKV